MNQVGAAQKSRLQKLLDFVERAGNSVPHPAVLFGLLIGAVIILSYLLHRSGVSVSYERINPQTHAVESVTTNVNSLLSADGIRFIFTSVVPNFINFGPVGIIFVAMIGIGLAERAGLIQALIRNIVLVAPPSTITTIVITLGVLLSIASDVVLAAYRVSNWPPNVINPLLPHFALVVGFAQQWQKDAGVGTVVAMMLPYAVATFIAWTLLFFVWFLLGIPFGP